MAKLSLKWLSLLGGVALGATTLAVAQDSGALLDALVRKGVLSDQEAEDIRTDLTRDYATQSSAGKLEISSAVTKLKISGDIRVRYQYDNEVPNATTLAAVAANDRDRNRYRYRVRLGFAADLGPKWTAALRLETAGGATSTNADLGDGTDNFSKNSGSGDTAYFGQAYLNYRNTDVLGADSVDVRLGKLPHKFFNPGVNGFWIDSDINFEGIAQEIVYSDIGLKDSTLAIRAGQFVLNNNAGNAGAVNVVATNRGVDPSLLLMGQVEYATKKWKVAPTIVAFAAPGDHDRALNTAILRANDTTSYTDLVTLLVPFEYSFQVGSKPLALYATYGYNLKGEERAERLTGGLAPQPVKDDSQLYNVGVRYGETKVAGDYQLVAEYRYVGNGSYSSLLLDSDFNAGLLNGKGLILSGSYNLTSAITTTITYFNSFNIEKDRLTGANTGGATTTRGNGLGSAQVLQIDLSAKF